MTYTIYHNPRCRKSREGIELLHENGIEPNIIEYIKNPLSKKEIKEILKELECQPIDMIRTKEPEFKELLKKNSAPTHEDYIALMEAHPKTIERPIVRKSGKAVIARPKENILKLFK